MVRGEQPTREVLRSLLGRFEVSSAVAKKAGGRNGLREDNADGYENGAAAGRERHGNLGATAFRILIATAKGDSALGEVFANGDFFLKTTTPDASEHPRFDTSAITPRQDTFVVQ